MNDGKIIDNFIKYYLEKLLENGIKIKKYNDILEYHVKINTRWNPLYSIDFYLINELTKIEMKEVKRIFKTTSTLVDNLNDRIRVSLYLNEYREQLRRMKLKKIIKKFDN